MNKEENQNQLANEVDSEIELKKTEKTEKKEEETSAKIKFEHVTKVFSNGFVALNDINLEIQQGEFISIVGHSGAGKSTLLKLIYVEETPTEGTIFFNEQPLKDIPRRKLSYHRRKIGTVFQDFKLLSKKTVFENIAYALEVCGISTARIREDVPKILDIVGLGDKSEEFPRQLSGGEQQKIVLARALIHKPLVVIADEPTGNLDPKSSSEIIELLLRINRRIGTTIILASHDKDIINKATKRVIVLDQGKIVKDTAKGKYKL